MTSIQSNPSSIHEFKEATSIVRCGLGAISRFNTRHKNVGDIALKLDLTVPSSNGKGFSFVVVQI